MGWLDQTLRQEYQVVRTIKNIPEKQIFVLQHRRLGRRLLYRRYIGDCTAYQRLLTISHPNLPRIYYAGTDDNLSVVVEEYLEGFTIFDLLETDRYTEEGVRRIVSSLCDALFCLHHHGIIHRDIKPENVIICNNAVVKLLDFDAARIYKPYQSDDTRIMGTAGYAAPEQLGLAQSDPRSDIYALGILMNVMLTGEHPVRHLYKGKLSPIIKHCIDTNPDNRYQSVLQLKNML